jgi:hypothetical protein
MLRKKRVTITEQAQAAIAAGMPVDQALAEHGVADPVETADADTSTEEETPTTAEDESEETTAEGEETTAEGEEEEPGEELPTAASASASAFGSVLDRLQASQSTIAAQAAQITQLEADVASATALQEGLVEIATNAIHRMQVGLGGAAADLSHMSAENILATYRSTLTLFEQRLPVGGKAEVLIDDGSHDEKVVSLVSPAVARATQIRK